MLNMLGEAGWPNESIRIEIDVGRFVAGSTMFPYYVANRQAVTNMCPSACTLFLRHSRLNSPFAYRFVETTSHTPGDLSPGEHGPAQLPLEIKA